MLHSNFFAWHRRGMTRLGALLVFGALVACGDDAHSSTPNTDDSDGTDDGTDKAGSPDARVSMGLDAGMHQATSDAATDATDHARGADGSAQPDATTSDAPFPGAGTPWMKTAPRATCGDGDQPDTTLSGLNGDYRCNLSVLGQVDAPHFLSVAWKDDCEYVNGSDATTVIQVSPAGAPKVITTLSVVGFQSNWESMKANAVSGLLVGYEANGSTVTTYDIAADCKAPVLQSSIQLGGLLGSVGHAGNFSPDGTIYYASSLYTSNIFAVDLAMPKAPVVISSMFDRGAHDLFVSKNGTRGYFAYPEVAMLGIGSFAIMDLSSVQARSSSAKGTLIKEVQWDDGNVSQYPIAVSYRGVDHLIITDELGSGSCADPKKPQWGYGRIFDISDEQDPKLVSLIKTEAQDPANCMAATTANAGITAGFGFGTHYCNVDRYEDPRVLACGNWDAGLRVYDIRNPWQPKEVAYFDTPTGNMPGMARILPDSRQIWIAMEPGTFYVLKIREGSALDQALSD